MKYTMLFAAILFVITSLAQDCSKELLKQIPGTWKAGMAGSSSRSPAAEQAKAKKITDGIHQLIKIKYSPKGLEALFTNTKPYPGQSKTYEPSPYYYGIYFMRYYCDKNIQKTNHETSTTLTISANQPNIHFTHNVIDSYIGDEFERENYGWLTKRPVLENGVWYLGASEGKNSFGQMLRTTNWIIAYNNEVPFLYVTRKEYLEKLKAKLLLAKEYNVKSLNNSSNIRPKAEQEADKNRIVEANSKTESGKKWVKERFLPEYKTDEQKVQEQIIKSNKEYDDKIAFLNKQLSMPANELEQDAIISAVSEFQGFVKEDDRYKRYIIKQNPAYYNKKLPLAVPQLFGIEFKVEIEDSILEQAYTEVMKALDFSVLKSMLGK